MFFSRWTLFQGVIIALLAVVAFIADIFKKDIAVPINSSTGTSGQMLMTFLFIVVVIGLLSLLMYFQTEKSDTFLKHPLWDKMYILMPILFAISLVVILSILLIEPLNHFVQNNRWVLYVFIYYVLFLLHVAVLALIHKAKKNIITNQNKIKYSFIWTTFALFVILFML
ncbi:hypothetical protein ACDX78_07210 [Virgibacillus oceani]